MVKRWYLIVFGGILLAGGAYVYLNRQNLGLLGSASSDQSPRPATISWAIVDRSSEGFKLEMPADTREIEVPAYGQNGSAKPVAMIYSYPDPSTSFSVSWADNPPVMGSAAENPDQTLDDARNGALARTQAVLVSDAQSTRQGFPVRDFAGRNQGGGVFNARLVLAGNRLYMLMASFPAASARRDNDVNRFFDSFHVVSAAGDN